MQVHSVEHLAALRVNDRALLIHHIVIHQHVFAAVEVLRLQAFLCAFNGVGENFCVDGRVLIQPEAIYQGCDVFAAEQPHEIVLKGEIDAGFARVSLAAGTAAQLVVDAAALMPLGPDDEKAARLADLFCLRRDLCTIFFIQLPENAARSHCLFADGLRRSGRL